jgi:hypothetical protein
MPLPGNNADSVPSEKRPSREDRRFKQATKEISWGLPDQGRVYWVSISFAYEICESEFNWLKSPPLASGLLKAMEGIRGIIQARNQQ